MRLQQGKLLLQNLERYVNPESHTEITLLGTETTGVINNEEQLKSNFDNLLGTNCEFLPEREKLLGAVVLGGLSSFTGFASRKTTRFSQGRITEDSHVTGGQPVGYWGQGE